MRKVKVITWRRAVSFEQAERGEKSTYTGLSLSVKDKDNFVLYYEESGLRHYPVLGPLLTDPVFGNSDSHITEIGEMEIPDEIYDAAVATLWSFKDRDLLCSFGEENSELFNLKMRIPPLVTS